MPVEPQLDTYPEGKICYYTTDNPTKLEQSINEVILKEGYVTHNLTKQNISTNGGNYLGELCEVDIKGTTKDGEEKEINIFVKGMKGDTKILSLPEVYKTELFAYNELSKIFAELQDEAGVPLHERYKMVKSYEGSNSETIILENVTRKGFKTYHRMDIVSIEFAEIAMKELAKLHGLSFALREKRPDYFERKIKVMKQPFVFGNDWEELINSMFNLTMKYTDDNLKARVEKSYFDLSRKFKTYLDDGSIKWCLCHGDYRPNNIMTKFINGKAVEIIPVDYQLLHFGCPVFDFMYFIFSCTDQEFRKQHLTHLKNVYYDNMRKYLDYFHIDVNNAMPKDKFEQVYKEKLDYGLLFTYMFLPFMLVLENEVPDMCKELTGIKFEVDERYKERLNEVVNDFIDWGFL